jgi:hypothetical protein
MNGFKSRSSALTLISAFLMLALSACKTQSKGFTYMPDMSYSPAIKAQELAPGSMLTPPKGTIARGFLPYPYKDDPEMAGKMLHNPLPRTKAVLLKGQNLFNTYCIVCHGKYGEGDGYVEPFFPRPPSLQSDKVHNYPDGRIFHIITNGQNLMPTYATQIEPEERWAIIHYVRALYRAKHPSAEDLKISDTW